VCARAAVLDPVPKTVIEAARFVTTTEGYAQLSAFAGRWASAAGRAGGCFGAGRPLAQRLVADGELVLDVSAKLAARVRVYSRGHGRKTGKHDAVSVGLAALDGGGVLPVAGDDALVSLRLLCDRREELTAQRTKVVHRLLAELTPGGMRRELTANKAQALLARIRPADDVGRVRVHIARRRLADIRALDARIKTSAPRSLPSPAASGTGLTGLFGVEPVIAGRLLTEVGEVARFAIKDAFASYDGTAPIDVSSGDQIRHRLSRAGNRRINHALHMMAVTQIRYPNTLAAGITSASGARARPPKEACGASSGGCPTWPCYQLIADRRGTIGACGSPTTPPPTRPASTSPAVRSHPAAPPPPRPPRRPAPAGSSRWTGKTAASSASKSSTPAPASATTSSTRSKSTAKTAPS
jgi:transposase